MSTKNVGNPLQGRRFKSGNNGVDPIVIKASIGDGTTGDSATPFLKFDGTADTSEDGSNNVSSADVTSGVTPVGVLVDVEGTRYWLACYPLS